MLRIKNIYKKFGGIKALNGVSLKIKKSSIVGLIGPNGSGKTTLFNIISGFYIKDSGEIFLDNEKIDGLPPYIISRKGLCRTFQISKVPTKITVLENMLIASSEENEETIFYALFKRMKLNNKQGLNLKKALSILDMVGLKHLANEYSGNLSGGQRKLLSLARIIMLNPKIILLDEPTAGVNPTLAKSLMKFVRNMCDKEGKTIFIVEHNMKIISEICDEVYVLDSGKIIAHGKPEEVQKNEKVLKAYLSINRKSFD